jgi:hypothetical protein
MAQERAYQNWRVSWRALNRYRRSTLDYRVAISPDCALATVRSWARRAVRRFGGASPTTLGRDTGRGSPANPRGRLASRRRVHQFRRWALREPEAVETESRVAGLGWREIWREILLRHCWHVRFVLDSKNVDLRESPAVLALLAAIPANRFAATALAELLSRRHGLERAAAEALVRWSRTSVPTLGKEAEGATDSATPSGGMRDRG